MHSDSLQGDTFFVLLCSAFPVLIVLNILDSSYSITCALDVQSGQVDIFPNHKNSRLYTVFYKKSSCSDSRFRVFLFFIFYTLCIYIFISSMFYHFIILFLLYFCVHIIIMLLYFEAFTYFCTWTGLILHIVPIRISLRILMSPFSCMFQEENETPHPIYLP